jgi:hypothetical protein
LKEVEMMQLPWAAMAIAAQVGAQDVEDALDSLAWEPDCSLVVDQALETTVPGKNVPSAARIHASALLPTLRVTVVKSFENDKSVDQYTDGDIKLAIDTDDDFELRGYLQWDLSALVFDPAEIGASARRLEEMEWRLDLARDVVEAYHERKKLLVLMTLGALAGQDLAGAALRVEELTAVLDTVTGGWFGEELVRRRTLLGLPHVSIPPVASPPGG